MALNSSMRIRTVRLRIEVNSCGTEMLIIAIELPKSTTAYLYCCDKPTEKPQLRRKGMLKSASAAAWRGFMHCHLAEAARKPKGGAEPGRTPAGAFWRVSGRSGIAGNSGRFRAKSRGLTEAAGDEIQSLGGATSRRVISWIIFAHVLLEVRRSVCFFASASPRRGFDALLLSRKSNAKARYPRVTWVARGGFSP
jgi:hypothetical protein